MKQRTRLKKKSTHSMKNHETNRQDLLSDNFQTRAKQNFSILDLCSAPLNYYISAIFVSVTISLLTIVTLERVFAFIINQKFFETTFYSKNQDSDVLLSKTKSKVKFNLHKMVNIRDFFAYFCTFNFRLAHFPLILRPMSLYNS